MYKFKFFRNFESFFSFKNQFKHDGRERARVGVESLPVRCGEAWCGEAWCGGVVVGWSMEGW